MFVMVTQALVFPAIGSDEEGCDKQPGRSQIEGTRFYAGPGRALLLTDQLRDGCKKHYKRGNRPGFMTPFPTMKGVPLGIEDMFISSGGTK